MAHIPGLDVFMPSTATDAAGMLNAAFESERPTLFLYPKALLNDLSAATSPDVASSSSRSVRHAKSAAGRDITFVAWGNTVRICPASCRRVGAGGRGSGDHRPAILSPWDQHAVWHRRKRRPEWSSCTKTTKPAVSAPK